MLAARNCPFLPALSSIIEQAMELPVMQVCLEVMGAGLALCLRLVKTRVSA